MYAIHFVLFVEALVLIHIVQLCLKSFTGDKTPDESAEPLTDSESTQEEENDSCPFAPWSGWSECTVTCGDGLSVRHRIVLILENCAGEMVQARTCSQRSCPHDREFTFQRKEEEDGSSKFSKADEDQQTAHDDADVKQEDVKHGENHGNSEKHVTDYNNVPPENFESENLNHNGDEDTQENDPHGRARGHSWTSDDGHAWGQQSSFDSYGEADDNCFSDCSPSNPPKNLFGSPKNSHSGGEQGEQKSNQETEGASAQDKNHEDNTRNENKDSHEKENDDGAKEDQKLKDEKLKYDDEISNDEDGKFDGETDFDDDDGDDDYEEEDVDEDENEHGKKSDKRRKQNHGDEDDDEQDDLEQEEEEEPEGNGKRTRRKKKRRRRKRKQKKGGKEDEAESKGNFQAVCDPTEICDTFMAAAENVALEDIETKTANDDTNEGSCETMSAAAVTNVSDQNDAKT